MNSEMKCAVCSQAADKSCSGCKNVSYCSLDHQKADWKSHKNLCAPYSVSMKDGVKVLILRRSVPQGTILLDEASILHVPESNGMTADSICMVCGLHMTPLTAKRCSVCTWPVCDSDCESHPMHKENECKIFASSKFIYEPNMLSELANIITQTRAMAIKTISPNIWNDLNDLLPGTTRYDDDWNVSNAGEYRKFVKKIWPHANEKERKLVIEDALTLRKVFLRRAFYANVQDNLDSDDLRRIGKWRAGFYVYKKASLAKHSCAPNCVWNISNFPDFKIRVRAALPLAKGQILTLNHLEHHADGRKGTVERRMGHFSRFGHVCVCERCVDPTEFGTYTSAIVCVNCRGPESKVDGENLGYLLPDNTLAIGIKGNVPWRCNSCLNVIQLSKIYPKIEEIRIALDANDAKSIDYNATNADILSKNLIAEHRDKFLHPNHWLIQKATLILIDNRYDGLCNRPKSSDENVEELMSHCQYMLKILNQLHPGFSTLKSRVTVALSGTVAAQMDCAMSKTNDENEMSDHMTFYTGELLRLKQNLLSYYKDDIPMERGREKSEMEEIMEKDVNDLTSILAMVCEIQQMPN